MELLDSCINVTIPRTKLRCTNQVFKRNFTVKFMQEYEVVISFHTFKHKVFKRYSQFYHLWSALRNSPNSDEFWSQLPKFPEKKLLGKKNDSCVEIRRRNLELWITSCLSFPQTFQELAEFLEIPEKFRSLIFERNNSTVCRFSPIELSVASFIKRIEKSEHKRLKALEQFERDFFSQKQEISPPVAIILLTRLMPLCGVAGIGSKAMDILHKLTSSTTFRYYQTMIDAMMRMNMDLFREMKLNLHLTRAFQGDSAELAQQICCKIKEQLGDSHLLTYILNDDRDAIMAFENWNENTFQPQMSPRSASDKTSSSWKKLNTEGYPGNLELSYRKSGSLIEARAEMEINASIDTIVEIITEKNLRKKWDLFISSYEVVEKINDKQSAVLIVFVSDRNEVMDLSMLRTISYEPGHATVLYNSIDHPKIPLHPNHKRITCSESRYDIYLLKGQKLRSKTDSTDESASPELKIAEETEFKPKCKLVYTNYLTNDMTRFLCSEMIEETNYIKEAWKNMKAVAENEEESTPDLTQRSKQNVIFGALLKKTGPTKSVHEEANTFNE